MKDLGVEDNTIVIFTTDNGVHAATWPDAGVTWFNNEKTTNWEGGFRVPCMVKFPGRIPEGLVVNQVMSHLDWVPTLMAAVGVPDIAEKLKAGHTAAGKNFKVHLDGYNFLPYLTGQTKEAPRKYYIYATDAGAISAIRFDDRWKAIYLEQESHGTRVWVDKLVPLKASLLFDLRMDPFEKAEHTNTYWDWYSRHIFLFGKAATYVMQFAQTFEKFPQRQKAATWNIDQLLDKYMPDK